MDKDLYKSVSGKFKESWHKIDSLYNLYAKSVGLNLTAIHVLEFLYDSAAVYTQKDICEIFGLPKQSVNSIIKSLWEQSYVELKEAKDRRNKEIILTASGIEYAKKVLKPMQAIDRKAWGSLTPSEISVFLETMKKYEKALGGILKESLNIEP
ncbi:MAG: MarR family winged helix-turn-helix transcriptional regulator [Spirochaetes bacterium]|nr:MarR family winged helix-turn-helix transcriptional regulator [Spirochaetota bacterium]